MNAEAVRGQRRRPVQREAMLQRECVAWFRWQYPEFAPLLFHPRNEAGAAGRRVGMDAGMGVVAGVPDLILALPGSIERFERIPVPTFYGHRTVHGLGIELKYGHTCNQSDKQKRFQEYWQRAGYLYFLCRSFDEFRDYVKCYIDTAVSPGVCQSLRLHHKGAPHFDQLDGGKDRDIIDRV